MPLSNPSNVIVGLPPTTGITNAIVAASASATQSLVAANPKRSSLTIFNDSTANLYVDFGRSVTLTDFAVKIMADGYYELPINYTGTVNGIWDALNGNAKVRDLSYS